MLGEIAKYFGCGTIRPDPSDHTLKWETRCLTDIRSSVLPHFESYPLISGKQRDVDLFMEICSLLAQRKHLSADGLRTIVQLAARMNPSGRRRYDPDFILESLSKVKA